MRAVVAALLLAGLGAPALEAQDTTGFGLVDQAAAEPSDTVFAVDRIVAVVGSEPILGSEVDERFFTAIASPGGAQALGLRSSADTARFRRQILDQLINEELLVQQAQRDTLVVVTPEEVARGVERKFRQARSGFASEVEFQAELQRAGFQTQDEFRRMLAVQEQRNLLQERLVQLEQQRESIKPVNPTEQEMREYFEANRSRLGQRPASITFRQLVVAPSPSSEARMRAFRLADSIATALRQDGDFATAARRFSQDSASAENGGDLGWQRRGVFVRAFDDAVFSLRPGTISNPVETVYGYHVIQVQRVQPTEVNARHILIVPDVTPENVDSARALAARAAAALRAGASIDSLQELHHDEAEEREAADVPLEQLPPAYQQVLAGADSTGVIGPFELPGPAGKVKFAVLAISARRPAGPIAFEDVREQIRRGLADQYAEERYIERLRDKTYVDIRADTP